MGSSSAQLNAAQHSSRQAAARPVAIGRRHARLVVQAAGPSKPKQQMLVSSSTCSHLAGEQQAVDTDLFRNGCTGHSQCGSALQNIQTSIKQLPESVLRRTLQVYVPPHPLVKHWLAVARNAATPTPIFRSALAELGRILIYEAVRELLPTVDGVIDTPMGPADVTCVDPMRPVKVCAALQQRQKQQLPPIQAVYTCVGTACAC
jgi:hypothetical protein